MNVKTYPANALSPASAGENAFLALRRVSQPSSLLPKTTTQAPVNNTMRATTITVILQGILTYQGYPHGGINE